MRKFLYPLIAIAPLALAGMAAGQTPAPGGAPQITNGTGARALGATGGSPGAAAAPATPAPSAKVESRGQGGGNPSPSGAATTTGKIDLRFLRRAVQSGQAELAAARLAEAQAGREDVMSFAQEMIADHEKVDQQLQEIARANQVRLPGQPTASSAKALQKLQGQHGAAFDKAYASAEVRRPRAALALFREEALQGTNPALKTLAQQTVPVLEHHLEGARTLAGQRR